MAAGEHDHVTLKVVVVVKVRHDGGWDALGVCGVVLDAAMDKLNAVHLSKKRGGASEF